MRRARALAFAGAAWIACGGTDDQPEAKVSPEELRVREVPSIEIEPEPEPLGEETHEPTVEPIAAGTPEPTTPPTAEAGPDAAREEEPDDAELAELAALLEDEDLETLGKALDSAGQGGALGGLGGLGKGKVTTVRPSVSVLEGEIEPGAVAPVLRRHVGDLEDCVERRHGKTGVVRIEVDVAKSGAVVDAKVTKASDDDDAFAACLRKSVTTWDFPSGKAAARVAIDLMYGGPG
jgi:outer membrane biosynthesis protein TonB